MKEQERIEAMIGPLLAWYQENKRELPWRIGKNPYHIWLSEIMLQQTRIEAVKSYYACFIKELPTIQALAEVDDQKLLKLWEGLGYYNRARNLKKAAQIIQKEYDGIMPKKYIELLKLPGIGEYTAGAIASIAHGERVPAVDGNVLRVISRIVGSRKDILLASTKKEVTEILTKLMPEQAGEFNEALMELGETICIPNGEPDCDSCPVREYCVAYQKGLTSELPVRIKKIKRKTEKKTVLVVECENNIAVSKRKESGLLAGLYEFPNVEGHLKERNIEEILKQWNLELIESKEMGSYKHIFSHVEWEMIGYHIKVKKKNTGFIWATKKQLEKDYPIPTAFTFFKKQIEEKEI